MSTLAALGGLVAGAVLAVPVFPVGAPADYQLGGAYDAPGAVVVVRDRAAAPAGGYDVCYLNAFQTQPGRLGWWRRHHPDVLLRTPDGALVRDPGWPGEVLLDTSTPAARATVADVVGGWVARCADDGFEAVELDNLDSFTRSGGLLRRAGALRLARRVVVRAHGLGVAVAQKNLAGLPVRLARRTGFDLAVAEECQRWHECGRYAAAYGRRVVEVEYRRRDFRAACRDHGAAWSVVLRDRLLRPPGAPGHVRDEC